jgi:hypothetical protein
MTIKLSNGTHLKENALIEQEFVIKREKPREIEQVP